MNQDPQTPKHFASLSFSKLSPLNCYLKLDLLFDNFRSSTRQKSTWLSERRNAFLGYSGVGQRLKIHPFISLLSMGTLCTLKSVVINTIM
jgi:hypothetical protein